MRSGGKSAGENKKATNLIWTLQTTKDINQLLKNDIFFFTLFIWFAAKCI